MALSFAFLNSSLQISLKFTFSQPVSSFFWPTSQLTLCICNPSRLIRLDCLIRSVGAGGGSPGSWDALIELLNVFASEILQLIMSEILNT